MDRSARPALGLTNHQPARVRAAARDRRGGARNLEEAVTSGAGFSARASPARSALASWRWAEKVTRPAQFGAGVGCA